ncbi:unnamed protein product (macronuclear) [Paramecium tetraurelia]|uniref:Uncharacterized protein n=1 Tax=Paramecium tetraurelia TaxID=5888 RepID=A0C7Q7_PARTE|nr:uncharacterized protein GSPATT00035955001 [Paramecium tetraurelia]CAK66824.1 unnamed protein product [Paramecium tetraurelia]|eukprot:XP_001434221.1 hypothetical protein (macronuclear) [Paramecium tetraurelia strain d4-2]
MQSIKPIVQQISYARQGINEKKHISENIEKMKVAFDQLAPAIRNQQDYIQNMNPSSIQVKDGAEKLQEQKRYFLRFLDLINYELSELITIARNTMGLKDKVTNPDPFWEKILYQKVKFIESIKDQLTPDTNYFELLFKTLNLRDNLIIQFVKALLHRKLLLWKDMNIRNEPFVHAQIKALLNNIESKQTKGQIVSEKLEFKEIDFANETVPGVWRYQLESKEESYSIGIFLNLLKETYDDLITSLLNYCNLSTDPAALKQVTNNSKQVQSLRQQIEILVDENEKLNKQLNELKVTKRSNEFVEIKRLQQVIEELEVSLSRKTREIDELMANSKGSLSLIQNLREKLKDVEEENHRYNNIFFPKQKDIEQQTGKLLDEFLQIKKDIDTYSSLFKMESQIREKALKSKEQSEDQVQKLVDMLGRSKQKNKELQEVIKQKESIINKVLEAKRQNMEEIQILNKEIIIHKDQVQYEQNRVKEVQQQLDILEKKYQDMFEINTHFNKRIYELERQKKELLDILKKHDIEPDPTKLSFINELIQQ